MKKSRVLIILFLMLSAFSILAWVARVQLVESILKNLISEQDLNFRVEKVMLDKIQFSELSWRRNARVKHLTVQRGWKHDPIKSLVLDNYEIELNDYSKSKDEETINIWSKNEIQESLEAWKKYFFLFPQKVESKGNINLGNKLKIQNLEVDTLVENDLLKLDLYAPQIELEKFKGEILFESKVSLNQEFQATSNELIINGLWEESEQKLKANFSVSLEDHQSVVEISSLDYPPILEKLKGKVVLIDPQNPKLNLEIFLDQSKLVVESRSPFTQLDWVFEDKRIQWSEYLKRIPLLKKLGKMSVEQLRVHSQGQYDLKTKSLKGELVLPNAIFTWEDILFRGLNVEARFTQWPLSGKATVRLDKFDKTELVSDLSLRGELSGDRLMMRTFSLSFANGRLEANEFPVFWRKKIIPKSLIKLENLDVMSLLRLVGAEDQIQADGRLSGTLDFLFNNNAFQIADLTMRSQKEGIISYRPKSGNPLKNMNNLWTTKLASYLENFHYKSLVLNLKSDQNYDVQGKMTLLGRNPLMQNEAPLKLNVNLEFNMKKLLQSTLGAIKISERLKKNLLKRLSK